MEEIQPHRLHGGGQHGWQRLAGQGRHTELTFLHRIRYSCGHAGPVVELAGRLLCLDDAGVAPVEKVQDPFASPAGNYYTGPVQDE